MTSVDGAAPSTAFHRAMILAGMTMATSLVGMSLLVVSVVLPKLQGTLSASQDQVAWVVTFNVLATAVFMPMTGWLAARFGRRTVMIAGTAGFTVTTILCGTAGSLEALVFYRILQGAFGAPLMPLANAIVLDTYPKDQHSFVNSIYGMGVVVGPIMGPVVGGYLSEIYSWRLAFFLIGAFSGLATLLIGTFLTDPGRRISVRLDWTGFLALSIAVICLQLLLDRGQRLDWFESREIVVEAGIAVAGFYVFVVHSLTAERPFLNPNLLLDRNFAIGVVVVFAFGMISYVPMVLLPTMLQDISGYPDSIIGGLLAARGVGALLGFFLALWVGKLDPRIGLISGFSSLGISGWMMMGFDMNVTGPDVMITGMLQGVAVGLIWVPLMSATYATLDPRYISEGAGFFHLLRNFGSSIFISASVTMVIRSSTMSYERLTEYISPFNEALRYPEVVGAMNLATLSGIAAMSEEIERQAAMIGYLNAFGLYTLASVIVVPLILLVRVRRPEAVAAEGE